MSDQVTAYGNVTIHFTLHDIYVDDATSLESVKAKVEKVIGDHLGIHDYTFSGLWSPSDTEVEVTDWEGS